MKHSLRLPFFVLIAILGLTGAGCSLLSSDPLDERREQTEAVLTQDDRTLYVENVQIKVDDLHVHLGKLRAYRENIASSVQWVYDRDLEAFETALNDFKDRFAIFKETADSDFLPQRAKLNEALVKVEDVYLQIITEFEVDFDAQP